MIHRILTVKGDKPFLVVDGDNEEIGRYSTKARAMKAILSKKVKEVIKKKK